MEEEGDTSKKMDKEGEDEGNGVQVSRGLAAILANMSGGNRNKEEMHKTPYTRAPRQQDNLGFDQNSMEEFSGWEEMSERDGVQPPSNRRGNGPRRTRFNREEPRQQDLNSTTEFSSWEDLPPGSSEPIDPQRANHFGAEGRKGASSGLKRDAPQARPEDSKRHRMDDGKQTSDKQDADRHEGKEKKSLWDKNKGNPDAAEQPEDPKSARPARDEPNPRVEGRSGRKPGPPPPRGQHVYGRERESRSDRDRHGFKREQYGREHGRYEQSSHGYRNPNDQGRHGWRENERGDRRSFNSHNDRRSDSNRPNASRFDHRNPPPFNPRAPPPGDDFSGGPTGALVKRLADCSVKSADDAKLATEVISLLLKSLKEFQQKKGDGNSVILLQEAEVKFNIMKALQSTSQTGRVNSNPGQGQGDPRPPYNPGHPQNEHRPPFNPGHIQEGPRPLNPGHPHGDRRPPFNPGHGQDEPRPFNPGHLHGDRRPPFNPGHKQDEPRPFNPGHPNSDQRPPFNPGHRQDEPRPLNPGHLHDDRRPPFNPGHRQEEPRPLNPGHLHNDRGPPFNPGHRQDEPRPPFNQRYQPQNYYPPPGGPGYQMDNGQTHYSTPPLRYNK